MLGLGGSVGTPPHGVQAEVLVVHSFDELDAKAASARGRIVLFNVPFTNYGETVRFRSAGPSRAARHGAVAMLVRAVGPAGLRTPHTGALQYANDAPKIPAAAIATRGRRSAAAHGRSRQPRRRAPEDGGALRGRRRIGERRRRDPRPRESRTRVVVVSGHLDSWDVGAGATDDGGGCVVTWEALRIMKKLNLRPRRTVRVVLWTNEENGGRGGLAYRDQHRAELAKHVMMLESDIGVFRPLGFGFSGSERRPADREAIATLLEGIGATGHLPTGGGGADIGPSVQDGHIASMSLEVDDSKYFLIHHTAADTVDKIDPVEMAKCAAAVAVMAYVVADLPERLGD